MLSKWTFYGLLAQLIFTGLLLAADGQAQSVKSVREHFIKIEFKDNSLADVFEKIEQLGSLKEKGIITHEEFEQKKKELLSRI